MTPMNVDLLEALVAVADEGGYARAARRLNLSQPAVYQRIQRLEGSVGAALVRRDGRRMRLTTTGQLVYDHGREVIRQMRMLDDALKREAEPGRGVVSIHVGHSLSEFPAPAICLGFRDAYPELVVDLRISARPPRDIDRDVHEGRSEVGLHSDPTPVKGLEKEPFYEDEFVAIAWPGHPFEALDVVTPGDFGAEEVIALRDVTYTFNQGVTEGWFAHAGVEVRPHLISNSFMGIRSLVELRAGVSIIPREHAIRSPRVVIRPIENPPVRRYYYVTRVTPYESATLRALRSYVQSGDWRHIQPEMISTSCDAGGTFARRMRAKAGGTTSVVRASTPSVPDDEVGRFPAPK